MPGAALHPTRSGEAGLPHDAPDGYQARYRGARRKACLAPGARPDLRRQEEPSGSWRIRTVGQSREVTRELRSELSAVVHAQEPAPVREQPFAHGAASVADPARVLLH